MAHTTTVSLSPSPGFCIKSTALNAVSCPTESSSPLSAPTTVHIPSGQKVFINFAWDTAVPPPSPGTGAAIDRAMAALSSVDPDPAAKWFVPLIVSEPRKDTDKAGNPSAVFDCIFNSSLKSHALRSSQFKSFLIELALQRIQAQYSLVLSRQIGSPNIRSKRKLHPRSVLIPIAFYHTPPSTTQPAPTPLIQQLPAVSVTQPMPPGDTLNPRSTSASRPSLQTIPAPPVTVPELSWSRIHDGSLRIALSVPNLTRSSLPSTTLDVEPRRLIFVAPGPAPYALDLDLSRSDPDIQHVFAAHVQNQDSPSSAIRLKRERAFDVDAARAQWRMAEGKLVIYA